MTTDLVEHPTRSGSATSKSRAETALAEVLSTVVQVDDVGVDHHFFDDLGADSMIMAQFCARVRKRADLPSVSMKDIYRHPTIKDLAATFPPTYADPATECARPTATVREAALAEVLAGVMEVDGVAVERHFFDDLGADSMIMAQFCARVRKRSDLPSVSMKDIYRYPTIKDLAASSADESGPAAPAETLPALASGEAAPSEPDAAASTPTHTPAQAPASTAQYVLCGSLQLLMFLGSLVLFVSIGTHGFQWIMAGASRLDVYLRAVLFGSGTFVALCIVPIIGKWLLIGRWTPRQIPVWSLGYFRFWLVKTLIRFNPLALMVGSPLYVLYLRALGARIGKGVTIFSPSVVCTDLLTIGDDTVIRKAVSISCYRAHAGRIEIGPVDLGREVIVSDSTVLDIETSMGDQAQLGHSSSLHRGQAVPAGQRWHGSPARPTDVDYQLVQRTGRRPVLRRILYPLVQVLVGLLLTGPVALGGSVLLLKNIPYLPALLDSPVLTPADAAFYVEALVASTALLFGGLALGLLFVISVPRVLNLFLVPGEVYPLFGVHHFIHGLVARLTNVKFLMYLVGDSSYVVGYLRAIGYQLNQVEQTGSNFGTMVVHDNPYVSSVGSGTVVADGLSINNADYSSTSFRVSRTSIGAHNFLGNYVTYPSEGKTGENCLLATKVMVPIDGEVREGVGLLGSPSFEIPRSVRRDTDIEISPQERRRRLSRKNRHNLVTIALVLLLRWVLLFVLTGLAMMITDVFRQFGREALVVPLLVAMLFTLVLATVAERATTGFRPLTPHYCSIYDPYFWYHERYWKFAHSPLERLLAGTPFKNLMSRVLGVRIGRKVFDDGCGIPERTLVTIGDHCMLNAGSLIQAHSQEDGAFKSDYIKLGAGCTVGVGAVVHYGVTMGDGSMLAPDSFLMKGEQVPPHEYWGGNPAEEISGHAPHPLSITIEVPAPKRVTPWSWDLSAVEPVSRSQTNGHAQPPYPDWASPVDLPRRNHSNGHPNGHLNGHPNGHLNGHPKTAANGRTKHLSTGEPWSWW